MCFDRFGFQFYGIGIIHKSIRVLNFRLVWVQSAAFEGFLTSIQVPTIFNTDGE